jgi:hypothetical protein
MLQLQQQGIKRALVDSQKVSADLLDAPGDPQPCCGPRTSSVLRTISASVPCKTSGFSFIANQPLGFQQE